MITKFTRFELYNSASRQAIHITRERRRLSSCSVRWRHSVSHHSSSRRGRSTAKQHNICSRTVRPSVRPWNQHLHGKTSV